MFAYIAWHNAVKHLASIAYRKGNVVCLSREYSGVLLQREVAIGYALVECFGNDIPFAVWGYLADTSYINFHLTSFFHLSFSLIVLGVGIDLGRIVFG